jgi:hypothetical protein
MDWPSEYRTVWYSNGHFPNTICDRFFWMALVSNLQSGFHMVYFRKCIFVYCLKIFWQFCSFQNRMLTEEVGRKSQLITALEQDKRSLIRQLFTQTASHGGSTDTIKSGTSLTSQSNIHQPTKSSSMNKTGHLDIKKLC